MKLYIVDVFTEECFGGNPAGIVILPEGAGFPSDDVMVKTAAELRYSETAFIKRLGEKEFNIRYFTPAAEVELCGHATIGSFYVLLKEGLIKAGDVCVNHTLAGELKVQVDNDAILMDMAEPKEVGEMTEQAEIEALYKVMGISYLGNEDYNKDLNVKLIPKMVTTGLIDIMMPVKDEIELDKINPDFPALTELSKKYEVVGVHAFTVNTEDGCIHARNFAPLYDIDEEAATGTSNGALTFYLYNMGIVKANKLNNVIQGEKMLRPSKISTKLLMENGKPIVKVGGFAVTLVKGEIEI
ncbi:MAG: PhzF family phenazine biosynthesis protein [Peptostreptococcaceae bacterium]|nr:PhzF family phenazine biosynthesis protein [Peptostreptococcaceae bacterium]